MDIAIKTLTTLAVLSFALVATIADLNKTHATNPRWVGHARFHVVWQVFTHVGVGVICIALLWVPMGPAGLRIALAIGLSGVVLAGFFVAAATMRIYGGELADPNGYKPLTQIVAGRRLTIDQNVVLFVAGFGCLATASLLLLIDQGI